MARSKVSIRFTSAETEQLQNFCNMVGMDKETIVKRSVIYAMNDTLRRAEAMRELDNASTGGKQNGSHNTKPGNSAGDQAEVSTSESVDSNPLADQKTEDDQAVRD